MFSYEMLVNCENRLPEDFVPPSLAAPDIAFAADPSFGREAFSGSPGCQTRKTAF